ncbi:MAG: cysteine synthase family protein [Kiritimatiellia bacterium]
MSFSLPTPFWGTFSATPMVPVQLDPDLPAIWCKLEFMNPSGSTKDRMARHILEKAWREGRLKPADTVVEASSGSTSIAMAMASARLGVRFLAVMPEGVSNERVLIIRAYGGDILLTPRAAGVPGAIAETEKLGARPGHFLPRQFTNEENASAHRLSTAREIIDQSNGRGVDLFVSSVGTGGTLVGIYEGLRESGCRVTPVYARPVNIERKVDAECCSFSARIPGVAECISTLFCEKRLPGLVTVEVDDNDAMTTTRRLARMGFPVGPSSGLNFEAARIMARRANNPDVRIVTVFPDRMERYFTTELFAPLTGR